MVQNIAHCIDHTLLKPDATKQQIQTLCEEAKVNQFASVCINPAWVGFAAQLLHQSGVSVCTVVGFPLGASTPETKAFETKNAIENGAREVDMVLNIGALKSGDDNFVMKDIEAVVTAARDKAIVKVIIETCLLTDEEKVRACQLAQKAGADFVKTSTGFSTGGATAEDVMLMKHAVGGKLGVKASGRIRSPEDAKRMLEAGATRLGTSSGVKIIQGQTGKNTY
ncbi:deoxyribose-phosphate aldolase [Siminovitchia sp. 179-K 8D1 HS]|uniref:deoxyribose-phosphate aldolase n=1 Tax=Siminovitchia sp. 179-K 8D1 HS TaxID=3142385 RepID=UPI0039A09FB1